MRSVMRGQKRVEDARERAYDPRIHLLRKNVLQKSMDCRVKPGNDDHAQTVFCSRYWLSRGMLL